MPNCAIVGCNNTWGRGGAGETVRMFGLPKVITNQCDKTKELSSKRRALWLAKMNRIFRPGKKMDGRNVRVCQRHFINGKPSALFDETHPDWAPTLHLGYERKKGRQIPLETSMNRYIRAQERRRKKIMFPTFLENQIVLNDDTDNSAAPDQQVQLELAPSQQYDVQAIMLPETGDNTTENTSQHDVIDPQCSTTNEVTTVANPCEQLCQGEVVSSEVNKVGGWTMKNHIGCHADLEHQQLLELRKKCHESMEQKAALADHEHTELREKYEKAIDQLALMTEQVESMKRDLQLLQEESDMSNKDNKCLREENRKLKENFKNVSIDEQSLQDDDDKTRFFTGIPSFKLLKLIYDFVQEPVPYSHRNALPKFTEYLITLMRLHLGVLEQDLAYRFNVSRSTVSKICSRWIKIMSSRLEKWIVWPERSVLQETIPPDFKSVFGDRFSVIIDCFEVFINRPSSLAPRSETFSTYKHHNTVKFLIGVLPQGTVCFVSKAWGGRSSDKHIILHSGFLDNLVPGDVVLADRGFALDEEVGMRQAKIAIPAFTKGKTQLSFDDVHKTREIANIRIHVERVIGFIRSKFRILGSILPSSFLTRSADGDEPLIDHVIKICCGIANMCLSIIRDYPSSNISESEDHAVLQLVFRDDDDDF